MDRQTGKQVVRTKEIEYGQDTGKPVLETVREKTEVVVQAGLPIDRQGLKQLTAALKDLHGVSGAVLRDETGNVEDLTPLAELLRA